MFWRNDNEEFPTPPPKVLHRAWQPKALSPANFEENNRENSKGDVDLLECSDPGQADLEGSMKVPSTLSPTGNWPAAGAVTTCSTVKVAPSFGPPSGSYWQAWPDLSGG